MSRAGDVKIWHVASGLLLATLQIPGDTILEFALHPDGQQLISGSKEGLVSAWRMAD